MEVRTPSSSNLTGRQKFIVASVLLGLCFAFLWLVRDVLTPFLWAIIAAYVLNPLVNFLSAKSRVNRLWVIIAMYVVFAALVISGFSAIFPRLRAEIFDFRAQYPTMVDNFQQDVLGGDAIRIFGTRIDATVIDNAISEGMRRLPESALTAVVKTVEFLAQMLVFLVATFVLLLESKKLKSSALALIPDSYREELADLGGEINRVLGAYVRGQLFLFVLMASVTYIILGAVLHVQYALVLSIMTGFLEWFPIIGPVTAGAISSLVGLLLPNSLGWPGWSFALLIAAIYTVLRHTEDYLVIPNVIGKVVDLHPLLVMFALFSGGAIGGVFGMFIAVPVAAVVKITSKYIYMKLVL